MLRNWPIRSKLVVILVVPLVALAVLSAIQVRGNVDNVRAADRIAALADFSIKGNDLVHALQQERYATNSYVGSGYVSPVLGERATTTRAPVDEALTVYRAGEAALPESAREALAPTLAAITEQLSKLPEQRKAIDGQQAQVAQNNQFFNNAINDLLVLNASVAADSRDTDLVNGATTLASISRAKEQAAQQRGNVALILFLQQGNPLTIQLVQTAAGAETAWLDQFRTTATSEQQGFYNSTVGRSLITVATMRDEVIASVQAGIQTTIDPQTWLNTSDSKIGEMRAVERRVAEDLSATSSDISDRATRDALLGSIAVALILIVSIVISLLVASPMITQLRRLRRGALDVADERLPQVVDRLHRGEAIGIEAESFPIPATSKDEIGQLADAFATVHQVAVRTAVEQAAMRKSIGDTFLNLARRSQALIHRQLKVIDALERKETDPDELEELFRLDHLATRMRRHAEDLIVLSGSKPARGWRRPVPIKDVVRGAVAEVEDYTRVKVLPIGGGAISGHAVGDVIHMLAELIENATSFSPPHTPVQVRGHEVSNGFAVEVEDRGLGMSQEEFDAVNNRLANPPPFDLSTSERLGLFVVGRLAERHSIQVQLRSSPYGGTLAIILLPASLLRGAEDPVADAAGGPRELATVGAVAQDGPPALDQPSLDGLADQTAWTADLPVEAAGPRPLSGFTQPVTRRPDETLIDDLPVFPTVRSSWFVSDRPRNRTTAPDGLRPPAQRDAADTSSPMTRPELLPGPTGAGKHDHGPVDGAATGGLGVSVPDYPDFGRTDPGQDGYGEDGYEVGFGRPDLDRSDLGRGDGTRAGRGGDFGQRTFGQRDSGRVGGAAGFGEGGFGTSTSYGQSGYGQRPARPDYARPGSGPGYSAPGGSGAGGSGAGGSGADHDGASDDDPFGLPMRRGGSDAGGGPGIGDGARRRSARSGGSTHGGAQGTPGYPGAADGPDLPDDATGAGQTEVGLPRRRRRANLAPQLRRDNDSANRSAVAAGTRSPEEIRSMMTSFQANFGRGMQDGTVSNDGDDVRKVT